MENRDNLDVTEKILVNILTRLKIGFETSKCNKTAMGFLTSYNIVKDELHEYNPERKIKKIR